MVASAIAPSSGATVNARPKLSARRTSDRPTFVFCVGSTVSIMLVIALDDWEKASFKAWYHVLKK